MTMNIITSHECPSGEGRKVVPRSLVLRLSTVSSAGGLNCHRLKLLGYFISAKIA